jgi:hypothetical protein
MSQKEAIAKAPSGRVRRPSLKPKGKMYVAGKDPNYEYRFVNNVDGKVEQRAEDGWEVVTKAELNQVGDKRVDSPSSEGAAREVYAGHGHKAVLMKIRKDWYLEDQAAKQAVVDERENATKQEALDGADYGKVRFERS